MNSPTAASPHSFAAPATVNSGRSALHQGAEFLQRNQLTNARECFERAARADSTDAVSRNCLGIVARAERRWSDAIECFCQALKLQPRFSEAHNNLGNALRDTGDLVGAMDCYRRALQIKPEFAEALNNLGVALLTLGKIDEAIDCLDGAIAVQPFYVEAHNNLANAYRQGGDLIGATASLTTALQLRPNAPEIHNNLANVWRESGHLDRAREHYQQALKLNPGMAEAWENLGTVLIDLEQGTEAIAAYEQASRLRAPQVEQLINLGNAYRIVGHTPAARNAYLKAACLVPDDAWHALRVAALCPAAFQSRAEMDACRLRAVEYWPRIARHFTRQGPFTLDGRLVEPAFAWQFLQGNLRAIKENYARFFGDGWPRTVPPPDSATPRVGVIVTRGHEGLFLRSLGPIINRMCATNFRLVLICPAASEAMIRARIGSGVELVLMPEAFHDAVQVISAARLAVLYFWEIGTDATNYFLPFLQLAPIQCTSWGVQITSGIPRVDYYLGSELVESDDAEQHYSETLLASPTLLSYQIPPKLPPNAKVRADFGFRDWQRLYVCAQQPGKFHPDFDDRLAGILRQDGQALIVLTGDRYGHATDLVRARLATSIPDVANRVQFLPRLPFADYLQLLHVADVLLDPPHFGGVNSTFDAAAVGQPVVTLPTEFQRGRFTAACLRKMGVAETIARDPDHYVELAVSLAADRTYRCELRDRVRASADALFRDQPSVQEHVRLFEQLIQESVSRSQ